MKWLLDKITDSLADAALLEMGVSVEMAGVRTGTAGSLLKRLKKLFNNFSITMADAALLEIGVPVVKAAAETKKSALAGFLRSATDTLADAGMLQEGIDIFSNYREAERESEHRLEQDTVHSDECQYGNNDLCFRNAA